MALPHGAIGWTAVYFVVFPDHIHFLAYGIDISDYNGKGHWKKETFYLYFLTFYFRFPTDKQK